MNNIFVLNKNYKKIGTLSNQGAKPQAPYYNDLYTQELDTGADTYQFSTISNAYTQDCIEIGNHIMFAYKNRNELFTITSIEYSHNEGYKTVGVYAEGLNFELLDIYMEKPKVSDSNSGTDNDNDGDDNYDDEYADVDDIYIDENGNIIYDKDGSGLGDVTVDGNGNIIYKRSKRKDGTGDSLEFKNISYPTFIKMMLKNTGWSYVCQPGLESNKQDMRVSYDKNIYAILQDSMQTYKGVELEFRYEYNNGKVIKTVYAYNDGGRGSFVGKRFEYGTNVKGITKMQEVTHEKEDAIIFVDDIGVEVTYDVDFALKSAEITDIEIGDTHYVIDSDFHPPMQIKARIGKIEVSFSDPTRNKMYLANNKKIKGAVEEIDDIIDERLDNVTDVDPEDPSTPMTPAASSDNLIKAPRMHSYEFLLYTNTNDNPNITASKRVNSCNCVDLAAETFGTFTNKQIHDYLMYETDVWDVSYSALDQLRYNKTGASGATNKCFRLVPNNTGKVSDGPICEGGYHGDTDYMRECELDNEVSSRIFSDIMGEEDRPDFDIDGMRLISNNHFDKHMLDIGSLTCALVSTLQYHIKNAHSGDNPPADPDTGGNGDSGGDNNSGDSGDNNSGDSGNGGNNDPGNYYNKLVCNYLEVWKDAVIKGDIDCDGVISAETIGAASITCYELETTATGSITANSITANHVYPTYIEDVERITFGDSGVSIEAINIKGGAYYLNLDDVKVKTIYFPDGSTLTSANGLGGSGGSGGSGGTGDCIFEKITNNEGVVFYYTDKSIYVDNHLDVTGDLNVLSDTGMGTGTITCDHLICPDINGGLTRSLDNSAAIDALQEEIRAKDEQIANLEARLARLEALLDNNNN